MEKGKDKRLIYILNHFSNESSSHFYAILNLLEKLAENGVKIALIIEKAEDIPEFKSQDIEIFPFNSSKLGRIVKLGSCLIQLNKKGYNKVFIRISTFAAIIAIIISFFNNQKTYFWTSGQGVVEAYREMPWRYNKIKFYLRRLLPFVIIRNYIGKVLTGPESMVEYFAKERKVNPEKIGVLYNDYDANRFFPVDPQKKLLIRDELGLQRDKKIILFLHQMIPERKSNFYLPFIIEKFLQSITDDRVFFVLAGGGEDEKMIQSSIDETVYKNKVLFTGALPHSEIDLYYKCSDIYIQPSYAEGFPRTIIEAMACALPIITTNAGGTKDILGKEQIKFMVDTTDREGFANKLIKLYQDLELQSILSKENITSSKKFSTERISKMYIETLFSRLG